MFDELPENDPSQRHLAVGRRAQHFGAIEWWVFEERLKLFFRPSRLANRQKDVNAEDDQ